MIQIFNMHPGHRPDLLMAGYTPRNLFRQQALSNFKDTRYQKYENIFSVSFKKDVIQRTFDLKLTFNSLNQKHSPCHYVTRIIGPRLVTNWEFCGIFILLFYWQAQELIGISAKQNRLSQEEYFKQMTQSKFTLSPPGCILILILLRRRVSNQDFS